MDVRWGLKLTSQIAVIRALSGFLSRLSEIDGSKRLSLELSLELWRYGVAMLPADAYFLENFGDFFSFLVCATA